MNSSFPPLYPQEQFPQQQNAQPSCAFVDTQQNCQQQNCCGGMGNLILPLLLKSMGGKTPIPELLKSLGGNSPLLSALSAFSEQKKEPTQCVGEKQFPEN